MEVRRTAKSSSDRGFRFELTFSSTPRIRVGPPLLSSWRIICVVKFRWPPPLDGCTKDEARCSRSDQASRSSGEEITDLSLFSNSADALGLAPFGIREMIGPKGLVREND